jgi:hypothetical protein
MQIDRPEFFDKRECPCGVCDGAFLLLVECPSCGNLMSRCEETYLVFTDVRQRSAPVPPESGCPACGASLVGLRPATGEQIQAAGFRWPLDYQ